MNNIFYSHYLRRQGKIFKDLAYLGHNQRINMLEGFKKMKSNFIVWIEKNNNLPLKDKQRQIEVSQRNIRFYDRLISYIRKNPNIPIKQ
jgi:hypothetical protein